MAIGPFQLLVIGFTEPELHGEIIAAVEDLKKSESFA